MQELMEQIFIGSEWISVEEIVKRELDSTLPTIREVEAWKACHLLFSINFKGEEYYAKYQFDIHCQPLPVIEKILSTFGPEMTPSAIAAWFHFPNGWIADPESEVQEAIAPKDALARPDVVLNAALKYKGTYYA